MNVADTELCQELYELSGKELAFTSTYLYWTPDSHVAGGWKIHPGGGTGSSDDIPAYDLGHLLRKLHSGVLLNHHDDDNTWHCTYTGWQAVADTPENAACKLAIELFRQGVL